MKAVIQRVKDAWITINSGEKQTMGPGLVVLFGVGENDGISFPEAERIAYAYRLPFYRVTRNEDVAETVRAWLSSKGPAVLEAVLDKTQFFAPKLSSKQLPDGTIVSPSLEDMYPFLKETEKPILPKDLQ